MTTYEAVAACVLALVVFVQTVRFARAWRRGARDGRLQAEYDIAMFVLSGDEGDVGELFDRAWMNLQELSRFKPFDFTSLAVARDYAQRLTRWRLVYRYCGARMVFVP